MRKLLYLGIFIVLFGCESPEKLRIFASKYGKVIAQSSRHPGVILIKNNKRYEMLELVDTVGDSTIIRRFTIDIDCECEE